MSEPKRLLDTGEGLSATLLASAAQDGPSAASRTRVARALGLAVAGGLLAESASAGAAQAAHTGAAAGIKGGATLAGAKSSLFGGLSLGKWVLVASLGGGTTMGIQALRESAVQPLTREAAPEPEPRPSQPVLPNPILPLHSGPELAADAELAPEVESVVEPEAESANETRKPREKVPDGPVRHQEALVAEPVDPMKEAAQSTIVAELSMLERARGETGEAALGILIEYFRMFPEGVLLAEARALEVDKYIASGQLKLAQTLFERFSKSHPASPLRARLQRRLRESGPKDPERE